MSCLVCSVLVWSVLVCSGLVLSCLVLPCLALSCLGSGLVCSGLFWSCLVLSCLVLSCLVLSCLVLSCLVLSCQAHIYDARALKNRERLHGHNYRVSVKLKGTRRSSDGYLLDFGDVKAVVKKICKELNEYFLCPMHSDVLDISKHEEVRCYTYSCSDRVFFV